MWPTRRAWRGAPGAGWWCRTAAVTFLFAPRRWQVLAAKLATYGVAGLAYGLILAGTAAAALFAVAAARGVALGLPASTVLALLARIGLAMVVYLLIGVAWAPCSATRSQPCAS
ncbi:hypothetical protein AB0L34_07030 [Micromonospora sp. NPDC052213]|uniref:hypothetical protein n=1 Tax=Micromonospora sp. NPDC052213 TaxID=3155812 RepID=UPI00342F694A